MDADFEAGLERALGRHVGGFVRLVAADRLTAGASLETYRLKIECADGPRTLAMRRTPGGAEKLSASWTPSIEAEAKLIGVARAHGVPEPEIYFVLGAEDGLGHGFVMEWIAGETLGQRIVRSDALAGARPRLAYQCGEILGRIHSIDVDATGLRAHLREWPTGEWVRHTIERYQSYGVARPMLDYAGRWLLDHIPQCDGYRLVHNDFRNGNLIVAPEGVVAVLDWEHSYIGDPMRDIGWLCNNSWRFGRSDLPVGGFGTYRDLFDGYESVTGVRVDPEHVRFWELFGSLNWAVGCMELANQHRSGVEPSVERLAIGRRVSECEIDCANILFPEIVAEPLSAPAHERRFADPDELLESVAEFLRGELGGERLAYLGKVAANSLAIVRRELELGPVARDREAREIGALLGLAGSAEALREALSDGIRSGAVALDRPGLREHLRNSVEAQVAIDQPRYSGLTNRR